MPVTVVAYRAGEAAALPAPVYLDANFLASWHLSDHAKHLAAGDAARELLASDKAVVISLLTVDEVWWTLLRHWYYVDNGRQLNAKRLKRDPTIVQRYACRFRGFTSALQRWPGARLVGSLDAGTAVTHALARLTTEALAPRDAFHLALIEEAGARSLVTSDSDFDSLTLPDYALTVLKF